MDNPLKDDIPFNDSIGNYDMIISKIIYQYLKII